MGLPKISTPVFEMELPLSGKKIKYRPFTVKEEKVLLMAQETKDVGQALTALRQLMDSCLIDTDVKKLPMVDLEYAMLTIRSASVDNIARFSIEDPDTGETVSLALNLEAVSVHYDDEHTNEISLGESGVLYMRYPTLDEFEMLMRLSGETDTKKINETNFKIMLACMDKIVAGEGVYSMSDFSEEEIVEYVDSMPGTVLSKMKKFYQTLPKLRHELKYKNENGEEKTFVIQGIESFFL